MTGVPIHILIVEDNVADIDLTVTALRDARITNEIHVVEDGERAVAFLRREGEYANVPRPDIVFLDLNIPKIDGHQLLAIMKADLHLRGIPVIVVSGSNNPRDVFRAYDEQVAAYIVKPANFNDYFAAIRAVKELWFHIVTLPKTDAASSG